MELTKPILIVEPPDVLNGAIDFLNYLRAVNGQITYSIWQFSWLVPVAGRRTMNPA